MLDKKTTAVLKALNKLSEGSAYKVITVDDVLNALTQKSQYDSEGVRHIIDFLEKQEYINIKFSEDNTYCYSLLPKARIYLEQETKSRTQKKSIPWLNYLFTILASFIGTIIEERPLNALEIADIRFSLPDVSFI